MKSIWMLAAVATIVACAGRGEDDMGAAPDRGDTTVTTGADTTQWDTTGGVGEPGMIPDTTGTVVDTATVEEFPTPEPAETDTLLDETGAYPADTTPTMGEDTGVTGGYDTTGAYDTTGFDTTGTTGYDPTGEVPADPGADPGMSGDTTGTTGWETDTANVDHGAGEWQGDSALTDHNVPAEPGQ